MKQVSFIKTKIDENRLVLQREKNFIQNIKYSDNKRDMLCFCFAIFSVIRME